MPNWFQVTTTIVLVAFTVAQGIAAVMAVRQDARARKQERDERDAQIARDADEKERHEAARKERELLDGLEKALEIHRQSTELTILLEQWNPNRSGAEKEHLDNTYRRLQLAKQLLEDQKILNVDKPVTARTINELVDQALEGLGGVLNEDADATTTPTRKSINDYGTKVLDRFDPAKVWSLISNGSLTKDADDRFSSHIEAATLFGKRLRAHTSPRLELDDTYSLLFTIIDPDISKAVAADTKDWDTKGVIWDAGFGEDEKAGAAAESEYQKWQEKEQEEEIRPLLDMQLDMQQKATIPDQEPDPEWMEEEAQRQHNIWEAQRSAWESAKRQRIITFGQLDEGSGMVYRYLGVFKRDVYDDLWLWSSQQHEFRQKHIRVADEISFDGMKLTGTNEDAYRRKAAEELARHQDDTYARALATFTPLTS